MTDRMVSQTNRDMEEARAFLRRVQLGLKLTRLEIANAKEMVRESRAVLERVIAERKLSPGIPATPAIEPAFRPPSDTPARKMKL